MHAAQLERHQVWIYLAAIALGLAAGMVQPGLQAPFEALIWPALVALLYATFLQVPLLRIRAAFNDRRFLFAVMLGNFLLLPLLVAVLSAFLPDDPALRLGVLLVLLVPCTDWFISFSQLGGGDISRAIAVSPLNLTLQLLLLPFYLWLLPGPDLMAALPIAHAGAAALMLLLPLALALTTEAWMGVRASARLRQRLSGLPVPLLALVVLLIAGAQADVVLDAWRLLPAVLPVFVAFVLSAAVMAKGLALLMRLPAAQGRTLCFSLATRNSFIVLPLALALPDGWQVAAVVIVLQSLTELLAMSFYVWWVPHRLFRR